MRSDCQLTTVNQISKHSCSHLITPNNSALSQYALMHSKHAHAVSSAMQTCVQTIKTSMCSSATMRQYQTRATGMNNCAATYLACHLHAPPVKRSAPCAHHVHAHTSGGWNRQRCSTKCFRLTHLALSPRYIYQTRGHWAHEGCCLPWSRMQVCHMGQMHREGVIMPIVSRSKRKEHGIMLRIS